MKFCFPWCLSLKGGRRRKQAQRMTQRALASGNAVSHHGELDGGRTSSLVSKPYLLGQLPLAHSQTFPGLLAVSQHPRNMNWPSQKEVESGCKITLLSFWALSCPLDFLPIPLREMVWILVMVGIWWFSPWLGVEGPQAAAHLQKTFTSHPGSGAGWRVSGHTAILADPRGRENFPFTDPICLGT